MATIKKIIDNVSDTEVRTTQRILEDRDDKLRMLGVQSYPTRHRLDAEGRAHHDCYEVKYSTKIGEFFVDYTYKFCPTCKKEMDKKAVLSDEVLNTAWTRSYDETEFDGGLGMA